MLARTAAVLCVVLGLNKSVLMATPASRNLILNFLIAIRHDPVAIDFGFGVVHIVRMTMILSLGMPQKALS